MHVFLTSAPLITISILVGLFCFSEHTLILSSEKLNHMGKCHVASDSFYCCKKCGSETLRACVIIMTQTQKAERSSVCCCEDPP